MLGFPLGINLFRADGVSIETTLAFPSLYRADDSGLFPGFIHSHFFAYAALVLGGSQVRD